MSEAETDVPGPAPGRDLTEMRRILERAVARTCPAWLVDRQGDIVQNALIRVMAVIEKNEESGIRTASYLWRVAYTATVNEIRRMHRLREDAVEPEVLERHGTTDCADPERQAASREIGEAIRVCMAEMIEPRRLAVLTHMYGYGLSESAALLGWARKRTDNLLYRGLADLRKCLTTRGVEP
jgi:RNA polymerase sigma-70 factor (ECF subfamily)